MMLPNGFIYGEQVCFKTSIISFVEFFILQALDQMARENNGQITCPKTKEVYPYKKVEKVYVM